MKNRHSDFCSCNTCRKWRQELRIVIAKLNGWTTAEIAQAGGLSLDHVNKVLRADEPGEKAKVA